MASLMPHLPPQTSEASVGPNRSATQTAMEYPGRDETLL